MQPCSCNCPNSEGKNGNYKNTYRGLVWGYDTFWVGPGMNTGILIKENYMPLNIANI